MKIAFVHNDPRYVSGTNHVNKLIESKLAERGIETVAVYPDHDIFFRDFPENLRSALELLIFFSACRDKEKVMDCDFVYGTTYSAIAYLGYSKKIISHFGSTMNGIRNALMADDAGDFEWFWSKMKEGKIGESIYFDAGSDKFLSDIIDIEKYVAQSAAIVVAASRKVKNELAAQGVPEKKIELVHNAIEDFWFGGEFSGTGSFDDFGVCYLGRIGKRVKDMKIKGIDRLAEIYRICEDIHKTSIVLARDEKSCGWMNKEFKNHVLHVNLSKREIKGKISKFRSHILIMPSRYEGFGLPLIEGMSQGLIPVSFDIGIASEVIENGNNGFIVASVAEMIDKIKQLAGDKNKRVKMSQAAIISSRQFNSGAMADKFIDIINHS